jgi:hypothetical protein
MGFCPEGAIMMSDGRPGVGRDLTLALTPQDGTFARLAANSAKGLATVDTDKMATCYTHDYPSTNTAIPLANPQKCAEAQVDRGILSHIAKFVLIRGSACV